jgi:hypothetical protein
MTGHPAAAGDEGSVGCDDVAAEVVFRQLVEFAGVGG